ncbi:MAG TPA: hypothetical protein VEJ42_05660 [Streptosporangiaceae bacterium]|nr:hypothetical protein [Streptosporangiaceae bacterium]
MLAGPSPRSPGATPTARTSEPTWYAASACTIRAASGSPNPAARRVASARSADRRVLAVAGSRPATAMTDRGCALATRRAASACARSCADQPAVGSVVSARPATTASATPSSSACVDGTWL